MSGVPAVAHDTPTRTNTRRRSMWCVFFSDIEPYPNWFNDALRSLYNADAYAYLAYDIRNVT